MECLPVYNCSLYLRIGYPICGVQCKRNMQSPLFKIRKNFRRMTAEHYAKCGLHRSRGHDAVPGLRHADPWRRHRGSPAWQQDVCSPMSPKRLSHFSELFFLCFFLDWNNGRTLCGQHNLCPQFLQASGKHKHHAESLLFSVEHLIHYGHGLPGGQGQHCSPDGRGKLLGMLQIQTEWFPKCRIALIFVLETPWL